MGHGSNVVLGRVLSNFSEVLNAGIPVSEKTSSRQSSETLVPHRIHDARTTLSARLRTECRKRRSQRAHSADVPPQSALDSPASYEARSPAPACRSAHLTTS